MVLLKQTIWSSPFFYLSIFFLVAGLSNLLYRLLKVTKSGYKKAGRSASQNWIERNKIKLLMIALIAIVIIVVGFIIWLNNI